MKLKVESVRSEFYSVSYENNNDNAMFYFDLTNYTLIVVSNRGNFIGKWHNNDDKSFLELICDTDKSQFLSHIAVKDTYNKVEKLLIFLWQISRMPVMIALLNLPCVVKYTVF